MGAQKKSTEGAEAAGIGEGVSPQPTRRSEGAS